MGDVIDGADRLTRLRGTLPIQGAEPSPYHCEKCQDTAWKVTTVDGVLRAERCDCVPQQAYAVGVPYEFQAATLNNYEPEPGNAAAVARALKFSGGSRDLLLVGGVGTGKTRLACSILNDHYRSTRTGRFARVQAVLQQLEPNEDPDRKAALSTSLFTAPLLVLDDLGAERDIATDYTRRTLLMIYEERGDRGLRTIWTSNLTLDGLARQQDDDRLASRIAGRADVVIIDSADHRLRRVLNRA
jgi:DNA replication protein DnaC